MLENIYEQKGGVFFSGSKSCGPSDSHVKFHSSPSISNKNLKTIMTTGWINCNLEPGTLVEKNCLPSVYPVPASF